MTKVQLRYKLLHPVADEKLMDAIAQVHGVYGMSRVMLAPTLDALTVEYDASRLNQMEVETVLRGYGLPVELANAPAG